MALGFGRKKVTGDAAATPLETGAPGAVPDVQAAPIAPHAPSSPPHDNLDAFDLDTFELPATDNNPGVMDTASASTSSAAGSAFDFPEADGRATEVSGAAKPAATSDAPLDFDALFEVEQANAARTSGQNTVQNAPAPFVPPGATIQEPAVPFYEPQEPIEPIIHVVPQKQKRKLPLLPILGALAILGLGGGAALMLNQNPSETEDTPIAAPPRPATVPESPAAPAPPTKIVQIKRVPVAVDPLLGSANRVKPGIAPASDKRTQLKALWQRGADAKHRRDYDGARRYWNQGLKIEPNNVGFQESIAKLPK